VTERSRTVAILGLGLIGGSLARDLAARGHRVIGADAQPNVLDAAGAAGVLSGSFDATEPLATPRVEGPAAGPEAGPDARRGAGLDARREAGPDARREAGPDARREAGPDARREAGPDARRETELDARREAALDDVDILVIATPVRAAPPLLRWLAGAVPDRAVLTDVGSTKRSIIAEAARVGVADRFVGGHPMAGHHEAGWSAAREGLFHGATVWLCESGLVPEESRLRVESMWREVGGQPQWIDAHDHDRLVAWASHLPQIVASALARALDRERIAPGRLGPGGRDATRLAGSDADLWTDVLLDNADLVAPALEGMAAELSRWRHLIRDSDEAGLRHALAEARRWIDPHAPKQGVAGTAG
jgi:prephenate dehydrogenase